jgi:hypothetical protein
MRDESSLWASALFLKTMAWTREMPMADPRLLAIVDRIVPSTLCAGLRVT